MHNDNDNEKEIKFITKKEEKPKVSLKDVEIFDGMTYDKFMKEIYTRCTDDRKRAIETYDNIAKRFEDDDDVFMIGDKANPYLDIATKLNDNLIKLLMSSQKILEASIDMSDEDKGIDANSILDLLDKNNVLPEGMKNRSNNEEEDIEEDAEEEKVEDDMSNNRFMIELPEIEKFEDPDRYR